MQLRSTLGDPLNMQTSETVSDSLVVKLNATVRDHYPPGEVDYVEVIRTLASLAASYRRAGVDLGIFPDVGHMSTSV